LRATGCHPTKPAARCRAPPSRHHTESVLYYLNAPEH
jgi:hypothetical protein